MGYRGHEAIWYHNPYKDGKLSRYYPDAFIKSKKIVVEVKSPYTYQKELEKNHAKFRKVAEMGLSLHLYVFDDTCLLYRKIYDKDGITVCPHPPAVLVFED